MKCSCGEIEIEASTYMVITLGASPSQHGPSSCGPAQTVVLSVPPVQQTAGTAGPITTLIKCPPFCSCGMNW